MNRLRDAPIVVLGQFSTASNATLLVRLADRQGPQDMPSIERASLEDILAKVSATDLAVYKPQAGESPLRDFPRGTLYRREVAAWHVSEALGWGFVPQTVVREGPYGVGSIQQFVAHDVEHHYFTLVEQADVAVVAQLRRLAVFDLIINNADRKASHVLLTQVQQKAGALNGVVMAVDHGVTFHEEDKLRTVIWDWAGSSIDDGLADVARVRADFAALDRTLHDLLTEAERVRLLQRFDAVLSHPTLPQPRGERPYPWPPI